MRSRIGFKETVAVTIGDGVVVLHRDGRSNPVVANILDAEKDATGEIITVYLDRCVHKPGETEFVGWSVSGAVVTEMRKIQ